METGPPLNLSTSPKLGNTVTITNGARKLQVNCRQVTIPKSKTKLNQVKDLNEENATDSVSPQNSVGKHNSLSTANIKLRLVSRVVSHKVSAEVPHKFTPCSPVPATEDEIGVDDPNIVVEHSSFIIKTAVKNENADQDAPMYSCDKCSETFSRATQLRVHIKTMHATKDGVSIPMVQL